MMSRLMLNLRDPRLRVHETGARDEEIIITDFYPGNESDGVYTTTGVLMTSIAVHSEVENTCLVNV
jgi:hypothetical protein